MNKHGQTLIMFVILIPIIIILLAIVVDMGLIMNRKMKIEEISEYIVSKSLDDEEIIKLYEKNKINTNNLKIKRENNKIKIEIVDEVKSIFGGIIGLNSYKVKVKIE